MSELSLSRAFLEHAVKTPSQYDSLCRELAQEVLDLRDVLKALVEKTDEVLSHPSFKAQMAMGWVHGAEYTGPQLTDELAAARKLLT
jgi:hypothetical protein